MEDTFKRRGLMLVLSSPSGAGKTTISRRLLSIDTDIDISVSATTRPRRPGEVDGRDYYFMDMPKFNGLIENSELLEFAKVFGNYYGTPKAAVEKSLSAGRDVLFDIDWQGTQQLAEIARDDLVSIFILPPSSEDLEKRLRTRAQDTDEVIASRMAKASNEMSHYFEYDYVIVNRNLDVAVRRVQMILEVERLRRRRQIGISDFVRRLQDGL